MIAPSIAGTFNRSLDLNIWLRDDIVVSILDLLQEKLRALRIVSKQRVGNLSLRRLAHPLEEREVAELIGLEYLEHLDGLGADVLHKVAHVARDDAHVTGEVVKGASPPLGSEDGHPGVAGEEEGPLVGVGVPVHLADRAGLDDGVGRGDGLGDGEVARVGDADLAARAVQGLLLEHPVDEVVFGLLDLLAHGLLFVDGAGLGCLEDVLFFLGEMLEDLGVKVEILGDDRLRGVG